MAQHGLDSPQIGPAFEQMSGKGVAESVRADDLADAGPLGVEANVVEHRDAREALAPQPADEDEVLLARPDVYFRALRQPAAQLLSRAGRKGDEPLLVPLPHDAEKAFLEKEVREAQLAQFAHAQAATVEELHHGAVALSVGARRVYGCYGGVHFGQCEHFRQMAAYARRLQQLRRVCLYVSVEQEKAEESPDAREDTRHGAGPYAHVVERPGKAVKHVERRLARGHAFGGGELQEARHVVPVSGTRIVRQAPFQQQVAPEALQQSAPPAAPSKASTARR